LDTFIEISLQIFDHNKTQFIFYFLLLAGLIVNKPSPAIQSPLRKI
jgi:hypothetical protein